MCMHACVHTVFYYKHSNIQKEILIPAPVPLEILFKPFKGDLWGLLSARPRVFPTRVLEKDTSLTIFLL